MAFATVVDAPASAWSFRVDVSDCDDDGYGGMDYTEPMQSNLKDLRKEYEELNSLLTNTYGEMYCVRVDKEDNLVIPSQKETEALVLKVTSLEAQLKDIENEMLVYSLK